MSRFRCFVDTSAFIALNNSKDQFHMDARNIAESLKDNELITTDAVINETYNILRYRIGFQSASFFLQTIISGNSFIIISATDEIRESAFQILEKYHDQKISYCDALSVAIMRDYQIEKAFVFDHHFELMGMEQIRL